jgi:ergothioneine biosynthesis glutamate--cysteine ligase EgtA
MMHVRDGAERAPAPPLSEDAAEEHIHGICFKTGPPGAVGVELEWLVCDGDDVASPVDHQRVTTALAGLDAPGALPGQGRLTFEPGGQVEISSAPAAAIGGCVTSAGRDLAVVRRAVQGAGLSLVGCGVDPHRLPARILDLPRYAAMEEFFDRGGHWGRVMMGSTASVQVCVDAGLESDGPAGYRWRWRLLHALGPVLVATFANSPLRAGRPTGWKSTRQAVWGRLDPGRTRAPAGAEPVRRAEAGPRGPADPDPRSAWASYALDAQLMCIRRDDSPCWTAPAGLTFRDWLRGGGERPPTRDDLSYHLSTLFPPVRPQGHLELRVIDAQAGEGWIVPAAVVSALLDDPVAAQAAMAAAEAVWPDPGGRAAAASGGWLTGPWLRAARRGLEDPALARASRACFEAADAALCRADAAPAIRRQVSDFAETYVVRGRCPADEMLEESR